jgi:lipid A 3-O-deacylase
MRLLKTRRILQLLILLLLVEAVCIFASAQADEPEKFRADQYGLAATIGKSYDPARDIRFCLISGVGLFDYEKIWHNLAPKSLRFKVEFSAGEASWDKKYLMTSANMFALYYLDYFATDSFRPYVEGGIGVIYTGFQVKDQGLKINFNPQMGFGAEFKTASRDTYFTSLRLHHLSNGKLHHPNRGVNSILLMAGRYF